MPDLVVVDASAILDAARPGPFFDSFSKLHGDFALQAPALVAWELGNVIHGRRAKDHGRSPAERAAALDLMLAGLELLPTDARARLRAGEIAARRGLTFYDASYLEAAERDTTACLLTQDRALLAAAKLALGDQRATDLAGIQLLARAL